MILFLFAISYYVASFDLGSEQAAVNPTFSLTTRNNRYCYHNVSNKVGFSLLDGHTKNHYDPIVAVDSRNSFAVVLLRAHYVKPLIYPGSAPVDRNRGDFMLAINLTSGSFSTKLLPVRQTSGYYIGYNYSIFLGVGFNYTWFAGLKDEKKWSFYAVNNILGTLSFSVPIIGAKFAISNTTLTACFSEAMSTIFIVNQGNVSSYGIGFDGRNQPTITFVYTKTGFPIAEPFRCAIRNDNEMVYIGKTQDGVKRLISVSLDGTPTWGMNPPNSLENLVYPTRFLHGHIMTPSVATDGTVFIPGAGRYYMINGDGTLRTTRIIANSGNLTTFAVDDSETIGVSSDGNQIYSNKFKIPNTAGTIPHGLVFHEDERLVVSFNMSASIRISGKIYGMNGDFVKNFPSNWMVRLYAPDVDFGRFTAYIFPNFIFTHHISVSTQLINGTDFGTDYSTYTGIYVPKFGV